MATAVNTRTPIVNCVGAPWYEDLSTALLDECLEQGVAVVGCTANEIWDGTVEAIENFQRVKEVVRTHGRAYTVERAGDITQPANRDRVGVVLGWQNPKPASDSLHLLRAFIDMGLRCCSLAFRENSYYGCGFFPERDPGLSTLGRQAVGVLNECGVVIDLSHSGDRTAMDAVELSKHPVVFSHSTARALTHRRQLSREASIMNAMRRSAPDELIKAAAAKGGVICPDARTESIVDFVNQVEYLVDLVGIDHVGVAAQDDWHRSEKDAKRIRPYLPGYDTTAGERDREFGSDYRIYRREGQLGPKLFYPEKLAAELAARNYPQESIEKVLGGNLVRVFQAVLPA